jgi:hypothetical protein
MENSVTGHSYGKLRVGVSTYPTLRIDPNKGFTIPGESESEESGLNDYEEINYGNQSNGMQTLLRDADESRNPVIKISSLAPAVGCERLRALFTIYGDVARIKVRTSYN